MAKAEIDSTCAASISAISSATLRGKASMNWRWSATSSMLPGFRRSLFSTSLGSHSCHNAAWHARQCLLQGPDQALLLADEQVPHLQQDTKEGQQGVYSFNCPSNCNWQGDCNQGLPPYCTLTILHCWEYALACCSSTTPCNATCTVSTCVYHRKMLCMMDVRMVSILGTSIMSLEVRMVVLFNSIVGLPSQAAVL